MFNEIKTLERLDIYQQIKEYVDWLCEQNIKEDLKLSPSQILQIAGKMDQDRDEIVSLVACKYTRYPIKVNNTYCKIKRYFNINVLYI